VEPERRKSFHRFHRKGRTTHSAADARARAQSRMRVRNWLAGESESVSSDHPSEPGAVLRHGIMQLASCHRFGVPDLASCETSVAKSPLFPFPPSLSSPLGSPSSPELG